MSKKDIERGFELLEITPEDLPTYKDAESFADQFKLCAIDKDTDIVISDNSVSVDLIRAKKTGEN